MKYAACVAKHNERAFEMSQPSRASSIEPSKGEMLQCSLFRRRVNMPEVGSFSERRSQKSVKHPPKDRYRQYGGSGTTRRPDAEARDGEGMPEQGEMVRDGGF